MTESVQVGVLPASASERDAFLMRAYQQKRGDIRKSTQGKVSQKTAGEIAFGLVGSAYGVPVSELRASIGRMLQRWRAVKRLARQSEKPASQEAQPSFDATLASDAFVANSTYRINLPDAHVVQRESANGGSEWALVRDPFAPKTTKATKPVYRYPQALELIKGARVGDVLKFVASKDDREAAAQRSRIGNAAYNQGRKIKTRFGEVLHMPDGSQACILFVKIIE